MIRGFPTLTPTAAAPRDCLQADEEAGAGYTPPTTARHRMDSDSDSDSSSDDFQVPMGELTCTQEQYLHMVGLLKSLEGQVKKLQPQGDEAQPGVASPPPDAAAPAAEVCGDADADAMPRSAPGKAWAIPQMARQRFVPKAAELGCHVADAAGAAAGVARQGLATTASGVAKTGFVQELALAADQANHGFSSVSRSMAGFLWKSAPRPAAAEAQRPEFALPYEAAAYSPLPESVCFASGYALQV